MTTVSTMSDSESSDSEEGLSENEELGLDEEMELTGKIHPRMKMMMNRLREGLDRSGVKGITLLILISLLLHSTPEDPLALS